MATNIIRALTRFIEHPVQPAQNSNLPVVSDWDISKTDIRTGENPAIYTQNNAVTGLSSRSCNLNYLPDAFGELGALQHVDLTGNQLAALPNSIGSLRHLKRFYLGLMATFGENRTP